MELTMGELKPYLGGWMDIKKPNDYYLQGGIKKLDILEGNVLKIEFVWKIQFEEWPKKDHKWSHVSNFTDYNLNLNECSFPGWRVAEEKTIIIYVASADEEIIFHMANELKPIDIFEVDNCPWSLEVELQEMKKNFLSLLNFSEVPIINFTLASFSLEETLDFMRISLKWQDKKWHFVRIQQDSKDLETRIYYALLHEIAERFSLSCDDIESLVFNVEGGSIKKTADNALQIWGASGFFRGEQDHEFIRGLLEKELNCQVV